MYRFPVKVEERGGSYVVTVPALPGCVTSSGSREEALQKVRETIRAFLVQAGPHFPMLAGPFSPASEGGDGEYVEIAPSPAQFC